MGTCQISCRQETLQSQESSLYTSVIDRTTQKTTTKPDMKQGKKQEHSEIVMITDSIASEVCFYEEKAPPFVVNKQINKSLVPRQNRFYLELEEEVKLRIREIQMEEKREKEVRQAAQAMQQQNSQRLSIEVQSQQSSEINGQNFTFKQISLQNEAQSPLQKNKPVKLSQFGVANTGYVSLESNDGQTVKSKPISEKSKSLYSRSQTGGRAVSSNRAECQSEASGKMTRSVRLQARALEKMASEYFYVEGERENRFQRSQFNSHRKGKGILKFRTESVRQILQNQSGSSKNSISRRNSSKRVRFSQDTNFNNERLQPRQSQKLIFLTTF